MHILKRLPVIYGKSDDIDSAGYKKEERPIHRAENGKSGNAHHEESDRPENQSHYEKESFVPSPETGEKIKAGCVGHEKNENR